MVVYAFVPPPGMRPKQWGPSFSIVWTPGREAQASRPEANQVFRERSKATLKEGDGKAKGFRAKMSWAGKPGQGLLLKEDEEQDSGSFWCAALREGRIECRQEAESHSPVPTPAFMPGATILPFVFVPSQKILSHQRNFQVL